MMRHSRSTLLWLTATVVTLILGPTAIAQNDNEVPSLYPGVWYRIALDGNGDLISGDGDGDGWHYYSESGTYRMWFYNNAYDPDRKGYLNYEVYIKSVDSNYITYADVNFCWTTPEWSALNPSGPPLPGEDDESLYVHTRHLHTVDNVNIGTIEPIRSYSVKEYNPEWVGIEISGRNAYIYRGAWHECLEKDTDDDDDDDDDDGYNVCCNHTTGHCYTIYGAECADGYEPLEDGQTCADCKKTAQTTLDFGDAPDPPYPTTADSEGARHTIVAGVFLGRSVDGEAGAQPNDLATGDDDNGPDEDGVVFLSSLQAGDLTEIEVTASVGGYLNAWVDFDGDGSFSGTGEQIFTDEMLESGVNALAFNVPDDALLGVTFARFRYNTRGLLDPTGPAEDGEVEDYAVEIVKTYGPYPTSGLTLAQWNQPPEIIDTITPFFFNGTGVPSSLDLQQIAADDLQFPDSRPVTGIHWWGTFNGWTETYLPTVTPLAFHIGIWTDEADTDSKVASHPGTLLWECYCTNWTWALAGYQQDTRSGELGETCFQFSHLLSQDQWFIPDAESTAEGSDPAFYWVSIASFYDPDAAEPAYEWGWFTCSLANGQGAMRIEEATDPESDASLWPPMIGSQWVLGDVILDGSQDGSDLAFQLTTYGSLSGSDGPFKSDAGRSHRVAGLTDLALKAQSWLDTMP